MRPHRLLVAAVACQGVGSAALLLLPQFDHLGHFAVLGATVVFLLLPAPLAAVAWGRLVPAAVLRALPFTWWALVVASLVPVALAEVVTGGCRDPIGVADFLVTTGGGVGVGLAFAAGISRLGSAARVVAAWAGFVLATLLLALVPLYTGPQVYVLHLVAGVFPGPVYDRFFELSRAALLHRAVGLVAALAVVLALRSAAERSRRLRVLALVSALAAVGALVAGPALGLGVDDAALARTLPEVRTFEGLTVRFDARRTPPATRDAAWDDALFAYQEARAALGLPDARATLYVFPSDSERGRQIGSRRVAVTKPWRHAAYLSLGSWDACTVKHELLHALLAPATPGWLGLPWTGLLPNLGLVEGSAEALTACPERFPVHWQARRMLDEGALPAPTDLVSPARFWTLPGRRAYAAAASFVGFLLETRGVGVVLAAYREGDVAQATGASLASLDAEWRAWLAREVTLGAEDQALLGEYLAQRSIFTERCSQERARAVARVPGLVACGAWDRVREALAQADRVAGEPVDPLLAVRSLVAEGRLREAEAAVQRLLDREPPLPMSFWARLAEADLAALGGRSDDARQAWARLRDGVRDLSLKRQAAVRLLALEAPALPLPELADAWLFPTGGRRGAEAWRTLDGLAVRDARAAYLSARRHLGAQRVTQALTVLRPWLAAGVSFEAYPEVRREALRTLAVAAYRAGEPGVSERAWTDLAREAAGPLERREPEEWLRRISRRSSR